jgi:vacuolar-type H+-ATPase subunit F/Vma7
MEQVSTRKIAAIGDALLSTGFALAGIKRTFIVRTGEEAEAAIKELLEDQSIGIVVIAEKLIREITNRRILNVIDTSIMPMFVPVPSYKERVQEDVLRSLIIRAIGIDIAR